MNYVNRSHAERPDGQNQEYKKVIEDIAQRGFCPFCQENFTKIHPNPIDQESEFWVVTNNAFPYKGAREHLLLVHKQHIETIEEISPEGWVDFLDVIKGATKRRRLEGASLLMRYGSTDYTGASVAHLHAQILSGSGNPKDPPLVARVGNMVEDPKLPELS
jgi:diadenosine tetraphosphate (Ap4A) HIT family hydrolase